MYSRGFFDLRGYGRAADALRLQRRLEGFDYL